ncbi:MAG TPA: GNAT family N-acetyltransferase [Pseudonocardia sp.]
MSDLVTDPVTPSRQNGAPPREAGRGGVLGVGLRDRRLRGLRRDGVVPPLDAPPTVAVVEDPDAVAALACEWAELVAATRTSPFTGPEYALAWWRHRGRGRLHVVTVRAAGRLVALAPLHVRRIAGLDVVRWLGHGLGSISELLVAPGAEAAANAVWEHLAALPRVLLDLVEYRGDGAGLLALRRFPGLEATVTLRDVCPVIELDGVDSAESLLRRLPKRSGLRRSVIAAERAVRADGVTFAARTATDPEAFRAMLPDLEHVHDVAEAARPRLHHLRPPWRDFTLEVLDAWLATGRATAHLATLDGRPAAFAVDVVGPVATSWWLARFDPGARRYNPGHLLMRHNIDAVIRSGQRRFDLLLGDGRHKLPWATASYDTLTVRAAPDRLAVRSAALDAVTWAHQGAHDAAHRAVDAVRTRVRTSPSG